MATGKRSARVSARLRAWKAPIEQPVATKSADPGESPWISGTTRSVIQAPYAWWRRARCSSGTVSSDHESPSKESTQ